MRRARVQEALEQKRRAYARGGVPGPWVGASVAQGQVVRWSVSPESLCESYAYYYLARQFLTSRQRGYQLRSLPPPSTRSSPARYPTVRAEPLFCRLRKGGRARTVEVVLQSLQQLCYLVGVVHVGFPLADHTVFVDDNCGPFPVRRVFDVPLSIESGHA